jgi:hypothetical protein
LVGDEAAMRDWAAELVGTFDPVTVAQGRTPPGRLGGQRHVVVPLA